MAPDELHIKIPVESMYGTLTNLDKSVDKLTDAVNALTKALEKQDERIRALEDDKFPRKTVPIISAALAAVAVAFTFFTNFLK